jgi:hypothetical protein
MKRYIYGMSVTRSYLIGKMEGFSDVVYEHIMKIVTSEGTVNAKFIDKWINDISRALYNVSKMTLTNKCKRLDAQTYDKYLFNNHFGDAKYDMKYHLEDFQEEYPEYSDFEITDHMVNNLFSIVSEIRNTIPAMIAEHKGTEGLPIPKFRTTLRSIFSKYIDFRVGEENWR